MSNIKQFWDNKKNNLYTHKEQLLSNIKEAYTEDFIENYTQWKTDLDELNKLILENLIKSKIDEKYFLEIKFNDFCSYINNEIEAFINLNEDIEVNDVYNILNNLIEHQFNIIYNNYQQNRYSLQNILNSIKSVKF